MAEPFRLSAECLESFLNTRPSFPSTLPSFWSLKRKSKARRRVCVTTRSMLSHSATVFPPKQNWQCSDTILGSKIGQNFFAWISIYLLAYWNANPQGSPRVRVFSLTLKIQLFPKNRNTKKNLMVSSSKSFLHFFSSKLILSCSVRRCQISLCFHFGLI